MFCGHYMHHELERNEIETHCTHQHHNFFMIIRYQCMILFECQCIGKKKTIVT